MFAMTNLNEIKWAHRTPDVINLISNLPKTAILFIAYHIFEYDYAKNKITKQEHTVGIGSAKMDGTTIAWKIKNPVLPSESMSLETNTESPDFHDYCLCNWANNGEMGIITGVTAIDTALPEPNYNIYSEIIDDKIHVDATNNYWEGNTIADFIQDTANAIRFAATDELDIDTFTIHPKNEDFYPLQTTCANWSKMLQRIGYSKTDIYNIMSDHNSIHLLSLYEDAGQALLYVEIKGNPKHEINQRIPLNDGENEKFIKRLCD